MSMVPWVLDSKLETNPGSLVSRSDSLWPSEEAIITSIPAKSSCNLYLHTLVTRDSAFAHIPFHFQKVPKD